MLNPSFYPAIFERKSIRKWGNQPLNPEQLAKIKAEIEAVTPLLSNETFTLELGQSKEGWRIYGYCENKPLSNVNLGYVMQQLDLALHLQGLGRLWFGFGREPRDSRPPKGLSYAMCLKIGISAEPLARESHKEFERRETITDNETLAKLLEPARLATSAMNSQPWWFSADGEMIHVWRKKLGLKKLILERMNLIDMGIALCHAVLALEHSEKTCAVQVSAPTTDVDGYEYLLTLQTPKGTTIGT